jgi:hypothetical protein
MEGSVVRVELTTASGARTVTAPTCEEAAEAVVVIVAIAVVEELAEHAPSEAPKPTEPPKPSETTQPPPPSSPSKTYWGLSFETGMDSISLPQLTAGISLGARIGHGLFSAGLQLGGFLPQTQRSPAPIEATVGLYEAMAEGCLLAPFRPEIVLEVGACIGLGVGIMPAQGASISHPASDIGARPQGVMDGQIGWVLGKGWVFRLRAGPLLDPLRPSFQISGIGEVYRPPTTSFRASAGIELRFQ